MKITEIASSEQKTQTRKPYQTPQIEQVVLVPEENVLGGCHTPTSNNGPEGLGCQGEVKCLDLF